MIIRIEEDLVIQGEQLLRVIVNDEVVWSNISLVDVRELTIGELMLANS